MRWSHIYYIPFIIQTLAIFWDEFHFHWKRGLPRWERIGHPLDTFSVVLCFLFVLVFPYSRVLIIPFTVLAAISCLLITKDEFVHKEYSPPKEQWLHALLFINHPLVLISVGWMWSQGRSYTPFLILQTLMAALFCLYQLIYWNFVWKEK